ncbi:MAG: type II toxin-antitoxin system RelE/ParE family toxin [Elusimicrobiota bacterium]
MQNKILYKKSVAKDFKNIDYSKRIIILNHIENDLAKDLTCGKQLTGNFAGLFSLRVGDYRVVYKPLHNTVLILRITHRKEVYK